MYQTIKDFVESQRFQNFIIALIILNGITMGLETSKGIMAEYGSWIYFFDTLVITIFVIEISLRIYVHRVSFFKDGWSVFDFLIVVISLLPTTGIFSILRILRVLRLFRLITVIPQMRKIVMALLAVIPGMAAIAGLLGILFYISAIMSTQLFGDKFPLWFGTIGESFYTLFQIMTLESWSMGIARPVMEVYPLAWVFFVPFIFIVTFIMINLIVAVVVDAMNALTKQDGDLIAMEVHTTEDHLKKELQQVKEELKEIKELLLHQQNR